MGEKDGIYKKWWYWKSENNYYDIRLMNFFINRQNMNDAVQKEGGSRQISITFPLNHLHKRESKLNYMFFF